MLCGDADNSIPSKPASTDSEGNKYYEMVDAKRFELSTSAMRMQRSPS